MLICHSDAGKVATGDAPIGNSIFGTNFFSLFRARARN